MKKKVIVIVSVILLAILIGVGGFLLHKTSTPEYALHKMINEVNESGITALKPYLTKKALNTIESVGEYTEKTGITDLIGSALQDQAVSFLKEKADEIEWSLEDVLRGTGKADVVIGFDYNGKIVGTVEIKMIQDGRSWKISGIQFPNFSKLKLF